jgi:hypothetical protein
MARCQYCGISMTLLQQLRGKGWFCSEEHELSHIALQEEAIKRLMSRRRDSGPDAADEPPSEGPLLRPFPAPKAALWQACPVTFPCLREALSQPILLPFETGPNGSWQRVLAELTAAFGGEPGLDSAETPWLGLAPRLGIALSEIVPPAPACPRWDEVANARLGPSLPAVPDLPSPDLPQAVRAWMDLDGRNDTPLALSCPANSSHWPLAPQGEIRWADYPTPPARTLRAAGLINMLISIRQQITKFSVAGASEASSDCRLDPGSIQVLAATKIENPYFRGMVEPGLECILEGASFDAASLPYFFLDQLVSTPMAPRPQDSAAPMLTELLELRRGMAAGTKAPDGLPALRSIQLQALPGLAEPALFIKPLPLSRMANASPGTTREVSAW